MKINLIEYFSCQENKSFCLKIFSSIDLNFRLQIIESLFNYVFTNKNETISASLTSNICDIIKISNQQEQSLIMHYLNNNLKIFIWNPNYTKIYETVLLTYQINACEKLISYIVSEANSLLKLKCGYDLLIVVINLLPVNSFFQQLCKSIFSSCESYYKSHEISTLNIIISKLEFKSSTNQNKVDNIGSFICNSSSSNENIEVNYIIECSKEILEIVKNKILKFCLNKNTNKLAICFIEKRNPVFLSYFINEVVLQIKSIIYKKSKVQNFCWEKSLIESKLVKILENPKGVNLLKKMFEFYENKETFPVLESLNLLIEKLPKFNISNTAQNLISSLNKEKFLEGNNLNECLSKGKINFFTDNSIIQTNNYNNFQENHNINTNPLINSSLNINSPNVRPNFSNPISKENLVNNFNFNQNNPETLINMMKLMDLNNKLQYSNSINAINSYNISLLMNQIDQTSNLLKLTNLVHQMQSLQQNQIHNNSNIVNTNPNSIYSMNREIHNMEKNGKRTKRQSKN